MVKAGKVGSMRLLGVAALVVVVTMIADELKKDGSQQHENERLDQAHQQLKEIEWQWRQPCEPLATHEHHVFQNVFSCEDIAIKPEGKSHRAEEDGDDL